MQYDNAVNLKHTLMRTDLPRAMVQAGRVARAAGAPVPARPARGMVPFAIGIAGKANRYRLAVRVQQLYPGIEQMVAMVREHARGECDVQLIGPVVKQVPWYQKRNRPLRIGNSIGHFRISAGTLGCFVADRRTGEELILSNNHVLANENDAVEGDAILQPGSADGGRNPRDRIGQLRRFIALRASGNLVDAAVADMDEGTEYEFNGLDALGEVRGLRTTPLFEGEPVFKLGRTTGITEGRVGAIELDGLVVAFGDGNISFDAQIQIRAVDGKPFSAGGDSGSLVVDGNRRAVGLLFAGNGVDSTFINPIRTVLDSLRVDLVT